VLVPTDRSLVGAIRYSSRRASAVVRDVANAVTNLGSGGQLPGSLTKSLEFCKTKQLRQFVGYIINRANCIVVGVFSCVRDFVCTYFRALKGKRCLLPKPKLVQVQSTVGPPQHARS